MKRLASVPVVGLFLAGTIQSGLVVCGNRRLVERYSAHTGEDSPNILYAEWTGKTLVIQGENFADGATVLIDGQPFKSSNGQDRSGTALYAKKAKKRIAPDLVIQLQVQNPDPRTKPFGPQIGLGTSPLKCSSAVF